MRTGRPTVALSSARQDVIDREAERLCVTRQAWIELRCADALAATTLDVVGITGGKVTLATETDR